MCKGEGRTRTYDTQVCLHLPTKALRSIKSLVTGIHYLFNIATILQVDYWSLESRFY